MNVVPSAYMLHTFLEPFSIFLIFKKILWPLFVINCSIVELLCFRCNIVIQIDIDINILFQIFFHYRL